MVAVIQTQTQTTKRRKRVTAEEKRRRERLRNHLMREWEIEEQVAKSFARKHAMYSFETINRSVENLITYFENLHVSHYGYTATHDVLRGALNHTLKRFSRSQGPLSDKQLGYFLQLARDEKASQVTAYFDPGSTEARKKVLAPLKQALIYENDEAMKQRLLFVYNLFVTKGIRLSKQTVIQTCTANKALFPHRRVVEDALETLRGAYEALGFLEGELFITPEYLSLH